MTVGGSTDTIVKVEKIDGAYAVEFDSDTGYLNEDSASALINLVILDTVVTSFEQTSTWISLKFEDTMLVRNPPSFTWAPGGDSTKVVVNQEGTYLIGANVFSKHAGVIGVSTTFLTRVTKNSAEMTCSATELYSNLGAGVAENRGFVVPVHCNEGDTLVLQMWNSNINLILTNNVNFDNQCAVDFWIRRTR
jgi:hypothetical protein